MVVIEMVKGQLAHIFHRQLIGFVDGLNGIPKNVLPCLAPEDKCLAKGTARTRVIPEGQTLPALGIME